MIQNTSVSLRHSIPYELLAKCSFSQKKKKKRSLIIIKIEKWRIKIKDINWARCHGIQNSPENKENLFVNKRIIIFTIKRNERRKKERKGYYFNENKNANETNNRKRSKFCFFKLGSLSEHAVQHQSLNKQATNNKILIILPLSFFLSLFLPFFLSCFLSFFFPFFRFFFLSFLLSCFLFFFLLSFN